MHLCECVCGFEFVHAVVCSLHQVQEAYHLSVFSLFCTDRLPAALQVCYCTLLCLVVEQEQHVQVIIRKDWLNSLTAKTKWAFNNSCTWEWCRVFFLSLQWDLTSNSGLIQQQHLGWIIKEEHYDFFINLHLYLQSADMKLNVLFVCNSVFQLQGIVGWTHISSCIVKITASVLYGYSTSFILESLQMLQWNLSSQ